MGQQGKLRPLCQPVSAHAAPLGWTQVTFAEYSGSGRGTIGRWTRGESAIPLLVERHLDLLLAI